MRGIGYEEAWENKSPVNIPPRPLLRLPDGFVCTPEFERAFDRMENTSKHLFITGKAGTGKSTLVTYFRINTKKAVVYLASTGIAALNIDGQTIHSFFQFPSEIITQDVVDKVKLYRQAKQDIIDNLDTIVIDEISMARADVIAGIDDILRRRRPEEYSKQRFGGVQMIFIGDVYQLPPIVKRNEEMDVVVNGVVKGKKPVREYLEETHGGRYFFNSKAYKYSEFEYIELEHIFRQTENTFIRILNGVRENKLSETDLQLLNQRDMVKCEYDPKEPRVTVCARNDAADTINCRKMRELTAKEYTYHAIRTGVYGDYTDTKPSGYIYEKDYPAEKDLTLKEGAQIMMLKNDPDKKWVNGTMGIIKHLEDDYVEVKFKNRACFVEKEEWQAIGYVYDTKTGTVASRIIGTFTQYPIRLAWAITIHKSQGKTFDKITVNLSGGGAFEYGQTYVALSRCTSLEGILLTNEIKPKDIKTDPLVIQFVRESSQ
jgi:hypothetical protein